MLLQRHRVNVEDKTLSALKSRACEMNTSLTEYDACVGSEVERMLNPVIT